MIHKVAIGLRQLMNDALRIIMGFAILEDVIYAEVTVLYKFAILYVEHIRETEYFFVICFNYIHYLVLIGPEVFVE